MTGKHRRLETSPTIVLPAPSKNDKSIALALDLRRTIREISSTDLSLQLLSDLLWSAYGVNRTVGPFGAPGRTAASASNSQEIDLYVAMPDAIYLYDAHAHQLVPAARGDFRSKTLTPGQKEIWPTAPVQLVFVVDLHRLTHTAGFEEVGLHDPEVQKAYYYVDTGLIAQNVYLFAAAHGLACWFHNCDREGLARTLGLGSEHLVLFAQSVGYPALS